MGERNPQELNANNSNAQIDHAWREHPMFSYFYIQIYFPYLQNIVYGIVDNVCLFMFFHALLKYKYNWRNIFSCAIIITLISQLLFLIHAVQLIHIIVGIVFWTIVVVLLLKRNAIHALFTVVLGFVIMFLTSSLTVRALFGLHLGISPWYLAQISMYSDSAVLLILALLFYNVFCQRSEKN
jgi:hypothetical protein